MTRRWRPIQAKREIYFTSKQLVLTFIMECFILLWGIVGCLLSSTQVATGVKLKLSIDQLSLEVGDSTSFNITPSEELSEDAVIEFTYQLGDTTSFSLPNLLTLLPNITIPANSTDGITVNLKVDSAGDVILGLNSTSDEVDDLDSDFIRISIVISHPLVIVSTVIGWVYFVAWSISFYPQAVENFRRKSVVGLNFDFLALNLTGFISYSVFNVGLYWFPGVQKEYKALHPRGQIPVELNDVIFALHALLLTIVTISQCFFFERGGQKISKVCIIILVGAWAFAFISLFVAVAHKLSWLEFIYFFSFIKLGVTLIKYMPQAWMNYRRKSTVGWSIGNVLLDFTGGTLSMLQMFLLAYNNDDWISLFGNPTKFGLGLFSVLFDLLFMTQHYILYKRKPGYSKIGEPDEKTPIIQSNGIHAD